MTWLKYFAPLIQLVVAIARFWTSRTYKRLGRLEAEKAQAARDIESARRAAAARRSVRNTPERVRGDPRNRDTH